MPTKQSADFLAEAEKLSSKNKWLELWMHYRKAWEDRSYTEPMPARHMVSALYSSEAVTDALTLARGSGSAQALLVKSCEQIDLRFLDNGNIRTVVQACCPGRLEPRALLCALKERVGDTGKQSAAVATGLVLSSHGRQRAREFALELLKRPFSEDVHIGAMQKAWHDRLLMPGEVATLSSRQQHYWKTMETGSASRPSGLKDVQAALTEVPEGVRKRLASLLNYTTIPLSIDPDDFLEDELAAVGSNAWPDYAHWFRVLGRHIGPLFGKIEHFLRHRRLPLPPTHDDPPRSFSVPLLRLLHMNCHGRPMWTHLGGLKRTHLRARGGEVPGRRERARLALGERAAAIAGSRSRGGGARRAPRETAG